jgi:predicted O-linked N-acetylglucosamine transferase (SPINDLY family)/LPS sulfotransferase NodH
MSKRKPRHIRSPRPSKKANVPREQRSVALTQLLGDSLAILQSDGVAAAVAELQRVAATVGTETVPEPDLLLELARKVVNEHPKLALEVCDYIQTLPEPPVETLLLAGSVQDRLGDRKACQASMQAIIASPAARPILKLKAANLLVRFGEQALALQAARDAYDAMGRPLEHAATLLYIAQVTADWAQVELLTAQLREGYSQGQLVAINESPRTHLLWCDDETLNLQVLRHWSRVNLANTNQSAPKPAPLHGRRLRVGYLSSDFREHPTSRLILGVLRHHNRKAIELFMYCSGWDDGSALRKNVVEQFEHVHSIAGMSDEDAAELIRSHGVDVLVELNGPTRAHRMGILRYRPAPVQVDYLGWPGSVGGRVVDYIVGDYCTVPEGAERLYPEKVIRLHPTYQANDHACYIRDKRPTRKEVGLPEDNSRLILGMFNAVNKVHQEVWDTWMYILQQVPNALLWMLDPGPTAREFIARSAQRSGVAVSRILASPKLPQAAHLARLQCCDLMLDPWPYGGHTSTADALFAGVPVLAKEGQNFASRVSPGLLRAVSLETLVCSTPEAYARRAIELLQNPSELANMRSRLLSEVQTSPLFDIATRTRALENAYRTAAERAAAGLPAIHMRTRLPENDDDATLPATVTPRPLPQTPKKLQAVETDAAMQAKFDFLMSSENDFVPYPGVPRCRYLLCSTARSGSNLVSDLLTQTLHAGRPMEYLNGRYMLAELRRQGSGGANERKIDLIAYLDALQARRTSSNGWFGLKAHFEHIDGLWTKNRALAEQLLGRFDIFIQLRRRDKLAQAVSLYRARVTKIWSSLDYRFLPSDDPRRTMDVPYEPSHIMRALADIVRQEAAWEHCLQTLELPYSVFWYEDFVADYRASGSKLLDVLGLPEAADRIVAPSLQRQGNDKDPLLEQFRTLLCGSSVPEEGLA